MRNGLNRDVNPELCDRVASIYGFLYNKLIDASVNRDIQAIDDALKVLRIERETWQILVDKVNKVRQPGENGRPNPMNTGGSLAHDQERQSETTPVSFSAEG
jgi:hypothetical protein